MTQNWDGITDNYERKKKSWIEYNSWLGIVTEIVQISFLASHSIFEPSLCKFIHKCISLFQNGHKVSHPFDSKNGVDEQKTDIGVIIWFLSINLCGTFNKTFNKKSLIFN